MAFCITTKKVYIIYTVFLSKVKFRGIKNFPVLFLGLTIPLDVIRSSFARAMEKVYGPATFLTRALTKKSKSERLLR